MRDRAWLVSENIQLGSVLGLANVMNFLYVIEGFFFQPNVYIFGGYILGEAVSSVIFKSLTGVKMRRCFPPLKFDIPSFHIFVHLRNIFTKCFYLARIHSPKERFSFTANTL